jgi:ZPR1 zinc finger protein
MADPHSLFTSIGAAAEQAAAVELAAPGGGAGGADAGSGAGGGAAAGAPSADGADGSAPPADGGAAEGGADGGDGEDDGASEGPKFTSEAGGAITALRSLCMNCHAQGTTRLLLTRIPFFRDIIIMAFECEECGFRNSEVQSAEVQEHGCHFEVRVETPRDLNRQLVKGDKATITIPELDFEIPAGTQSGVFTTIEGVLDRARENLDASQPVRRALDAAAADAVDAFLAKLAALREGQAFTLSLDDPSGNSFIENPFAPRADPRMKARY